MLDPNLATPPADHSAPPRSQFKFHGKASELALLILKNILLTLVTIGFYYPWAKTEVRKYLWSRSSLNGDRFEFSGTGGEVFLGYFKAITVYLLFIILTTATSSMPDLNLFLTSLFLLFFILVMPFVIFGSHRYKLSRTKLRGVAFRTEITDRSQFVTTYYRDTILSIITLGLYLPILGFHIHQGLINASRFGNKKFNYTGEGKREWMISATNLLAIIFTAYLFTPWAVVRKMKYQLRNTYFGQAHLETNISGLGLMGIILLSLFGTIFTLGLAGPWITTFITTYSLGKLSLVGSVDFSEIKSVASEGDAIGDAGADFLDIDAGVF